MIAGAFADALLMFALCSYRPSVSPTITNIEDSPSYAGSRQHCRKPLHRGLLRYVKSCRYASTPNSAPQAHGEEDVLVLGHVLGKCGYGVTALSGADTDSEFVGSFREAVLVNEQTSGI